MKKQTAVEFLIERWLERRAELKGEDMFQAMQMEKEQIILAHIKARDIMSPNSCEEAENYYDLVYKK